MFLLKTVSQLRAAVQLNALLCPCLVNHTRMTRTPVAPDKKQYLYFAAILAGFNINTLEWLFSTLELRELELELCEYDILLAKPIALKFDRYIGSSTAKMYADCQNDIFIKASNIPASWLHEILG